MDVNDDEMRQLFRRELSGTLTTFAKRAIELIQNRGFDVSPLRAFIADVMDADAIIHSPIDFYIITYSVTDRKSLELRARDLAPEQLCDMLLASAYLPCRCTRLWPTATGTFWWSGFTASAWKNGSACRRTHI